MLARQVILDLTPTYIPQTEVLLSPHNQFKAHPDNFNTTRWKIKTSKNLSPLKIFAFTKGFLSKFKKNVIVGIGTEIVEFRAIHGPMTRLGRITVQL